MLPSPTKPIFSGVEVARLRRIVFFRQEFGRSGPNDRETSAKEFITAQQFDFV